MDLHEYNEMNLITATFKFPGVKKEDVQIELTNGQLTVSAETKVFSEHNEDGFAGVKDKEIKASMENGVLTVTFLKTGAEAAPKKITIS